MIDKKFALGTWEIHLQPENFRTKEFESDIFTYVDTAIDYNNDYLIDTRFKLISKISSYHLSEYEFFVSNHLKCLRRDKIDIMLIHSSRGNWQDLAKKIKADNRFLEIGVSNFNIDEIEQFKTIVGYYPAYNEIEINPYYTDIETIGFCKQYGIKIISYGIVGGKYDAIRTIATYSLPYLLMYASTYADIVILKPESEQHLLEFSDCVKNLDPSKYTYSYLPITVDNSVDADNKRIVPMRYSVPSIMKTFNGKPTYHNCCGQNSPSVKLVATKLNLVDLPEFEMLGDYQTYLRYKFRQNYTNKKVYDYDFLIGDDGNYYVVYIYDKNHNLTKVTQNNHVEVYRYDQV